MRRDELRLTDMLAALDDIATFISSEDYQSYLQNRMLQSAMQMQILIVGESAAHVSKELQDKYSDIPWNKLRGFRNLIAHEYFGLDYEAIWKAAVNDCPTLKARITTILDTEFPNLFSAEP